MHLHYSTTSAPFTPKPHFGKKVKAQPYKSTFRAALFMRDLQALSAASKPGSIGKTSVCIPPPVTPSSVVLPGLSFVASSTKASIGCGYKKSSKKSARRYPLWWRDALKQFQHLPPPKRRVPPTWDELPDVAKADYYHDALASMGIVHTFTCRLRDDVEAQVRAHPGGTDWLRRRIAERLEAWLHRPIPLFAVFEEDGAGALHVHGEFCVTDNELWEARKALREACGEWKVARQKQAKCHDYQPDYGWVSYICKLLAGYAAIRRAGSRTAPDVAGGFLTVSRPVAQAARKLFERDRWNYIKARCLMA